MFNNLKLKISDAISNAISNAEEIAQSLFVGVACGALGVTEEEVDAISEAVDRSEVEGTFVPIVRIRRPWDRFGLVCPWPTRATGRLRLKAVVVVSELAPDYIIHHEMAHIELGDVPTTMSTATECVAAWRHSRATRACPIKLAQVERRVNSHVIALHSGDIRVAAGLIVAQKTYEQAARAHELRWDWDFQSKLFMAAYRGMRSKPGDHMGGVAAANEAVMELVEEMSSQVELLLCSEFGVDYASFLGAKDEAVRLMSMAQFGI
jgi:hypothetical protein